MGESAMVLGAWLASDNANVVRDKESIDILVLNARTLGEVIDLVTPLSRKLKGGISVYAQGLTDKAQEASPPKVRFRKAEEGVWDLIILSPHSIETAGSKSIRADVMHALTIIKLSPDSRIIMCVPTSPEASPVTLRVRIFGHSPPAT